MMFRSVSRMKKNPDRARAHVKAICMSEQMKDKTISGRMSTFAGKCSMTEEQLEYMIQCAKETHARKTW